MLKQLRDKKRARRLMWAALILIIPSFVLFYGWSSIARRQARQEIEVARFSPPGAYHLVFEDWRRWHVLDRMQMQAAQQSVLEKLASMFGQEMAVRWKETFGLDRLIGTGDVALNEAINSWILDEYASKEHVTVPDDELRYRLAAKLQSVPKQFWDRVIRDMGYPSRQAFVNSVRARARIERAEMSFVDREPVSMEEAYDVWRTEKQELALDVVSFSLISYRKDVKVTDEALREYYDGHLEDFRVGDQRRYRYAYLDKQDLADQVELTSGAARAYYDEHTDEYKTRARVKVRQIVLDVDAEASVEATTATFQRAAALKARIDAGEDFAAVAKSVKQKAPAELWIGQDSLQDVGYSYAREAFSLEPGKVAGPFRATGSAISGYVIAKAVERTEPGRKPFEDVREEARQGALEVALDKKFQERSSEISARSEDFSTLKGMAKELKMHDGLTSWVLVDSLILSRDLGYMQKSNLDFIKTLAVGEGSGALYGSDKLFFVRPVEDKPSHVPAFEEVRDDVEAAYRDAKGREAIEAAAREFAAKIEPGDSLTSVAAKNGLKAAKTPFFVRGAMNDPSTMPPVLTAPLRDFALASLQIAQGDTRVSPAGYTDDAPIAWVVWQVREIKTPDRQEFVADFPQYATRQMVIGHQRLLNEWLWDQRAKMRIEKSERWSQ